MAETETMSANVKGLLSDIVRKHPLEFDEWMEEREASAAADARPIIYVSVSGGVAEDGHYKSDGSYYDLAHEDLPYEFILIDWDNVEGEADDPPNQQYAIPDVREILAQPWLPERLRADIQSSLDHALRWQESESRAPYEHD
ncbi:MAG TPA: hypothetical protein VFX15_03160 [Actinomycetes bacterium]|nr:hypothetical protein [Actinomycetes bacterium]